MPDELLTIAEAAAFLKVKTKTLANWRWHQKRGPKFIRLDPNSRRPVIRYRKSDLEAFLSAGRVAL